MNGGVRRKVEAVQLHVCVHIFLLAHLLVKLFLQCCATIFSAVTPTLSVQERSEVTIITITHTGADREVNNVFIRLLR